MHYGSFYSDNSGSDTSRVEEAGLKETLGITFSHSMADIAATDWDTLATEQTDYPFIRHAFLATLETSACVSEQTGWTPEHLLIHRGTHLVAAMPMYRKTHSWGEYVFDQTWAQAYERHGSSYYPKLVTAIPFTPCLGPRLICAKTAKAALWPRVLDAIRRYCDRESCSSWHLLFSDKPELLSGTGLLSRVDIQFQWFNPGFASFMAFLETMSSSKRKKIKRERRRVIEEGIKFRQLTGAGLNASVWSQFYLFYAATYLKRGRVPYLTQDCFEQWAESLPDQMLLVMAYHGSRPVAAALSFIDHKTLYGRYWGCLEEYHSLHFETCYYQGIEFCIEQGLQRFDSGAQGEHKLARGFEPVKTTSLHWIQNPDFRQAIGHFVVQESRYMEQYQQAASDALPFREEISG